MKIDIILPVYNEEKILSKNIRHILDFINDQKLPARLVIVTNGCRDNSEAIARSFAQKHEEVAHYNLLAKGKGRAIKFAIVRSQADIIGYIDADLAIDIKFFYRALLNLSDNYDIVICSKMKAGAKSQRSPIRTALSYFYIKIMQFVFAVEVSDLQAGCKVFSAPAAKYLAARAQNNKWFFDTEFILLARDNNFQIKEIAADCFDKRARLNNLLPIIFDHLGGIIKFFSRAWHTPAR